jgi:hypothetical protein
LASLFPFQGASKAGPARIHIFVVIAGNGYLQGRTTFQAGFNAWLAFIQRTDILTTMVLTAAVTVLLVYWHRDQERKPGGSGRPSL